MITLYYRYDEVPEEFLPPVDEGKCQLRIACEEAWIGLSSEGEFRSFALITNKGDAPDAKPVLACEDCESWLGDAYEEGRVS